MTIDQGNPREVKGTTLKVSGLPGGSHTFTVYAVNTKPGPTDGASFTTFDSFDKNTVFATLARSGAREASVSLDFTVPKGDGGSCKATKVARKSVGENGTFQFDNPRAQSGLRVEYTCRFDHNGAVSGSVTADLAAQVNPAITAVTEVESARTKKGTVINVDVSGLDGWNIRDLDLEVSGKDQSGNELGWNQHRRPSIREGGWAITLQNLKPGDEWTITATLKFRGGETLNSMKTEISIPNPSPAEPPDEESASSVSYLHNWLNLNPLIPVSKPLYPQLIPLIEQPTLPSENLPS